MASKAGKNKVKLKVLLECFAINPILADVNGFNWLDTHAIMKIGHDIDYIMINMKKIKLEDMSLEWQEELKYPFTYDEFLAAAKTFASVAVLKSQSWLSKLKYLKDYILAPLLVSSREIVIGILIFNTHIVASTTILECYNCLSDLNASSGNSITDKCKCDLIKGILAMDGNKISPQMKNYIMNCRGYIPKVKIHRQEKKITARNFFKKQG